MNFTNANLIKNIAVTGLCIALFSCNMLKAQSSGYGIEGYVYVKAGNQMPMKGKPPAKGKPLSAEIWAYPLLTSSNITGALPWFKGINMQPVAHTQSDSSGHYRLPLLAGSYSVLIKYQGQYFCNDINSNGQLSAVSIVANKVTQHNITVQTRALY